MCECQCETGENTRNPNTLQKCPNLILFTLEMDTFSLMWYKKVRLGPLWSINEYDSMAAADCKTLALVEGAALCMIVSGDTAGCSTCKAWLLSCFPYICFNEMWLQAFFLAYMHTCSAFIHTTDTAPIRVRQADCIKLKSSMDQVTCACASVCVSSLSTFSPFLCCETESYFLWFT